MPPSSTVTEFSDATLDPPVRGFLHTPQSPDGDGIVLTHGAGSNANAPLLAALAEAFAASGMTVLRCDLPYRQARAYGPPGPGDATRDRRGLRNAAEALRKIAPGRRFLGGHSYGGRQSSMLCSDDPQLVAGLLLLSYPLHPPRRPEQARIQHLPKLNTPALFVSGTRDPFGTVEELEQALNLIPARTKLMSVEGAGHDLGWKGKATKPELVKEIDVAFSEFFGRPDH